jgi:hypothetical protein
MADMTNPPKSPFCKGGLETAGILPPFIKGGIGGILPL